MNGETQSKILLVLIIGLLALICGTIASAFVHLDLPQESILEEIENTTNISINDSSNVTNTTPQTTYKKKTYKSSSSSSKYKTDTSTSTSDSSSQDSSTSSSSSSSHTGSSSGTGSSSSNGHTGSGSHESSSSGSHDSSE